jgi:type II restriction/modification system DNA methylase subunit YeeA
LLPRTSPEQLYGIETNVYAHELASVVVWIGYIQWQHDNGYNFGSHPILRPLHNIQRMDAVLAYKEKGQPVEPEWPEAYVIIGNPPFLGGEKQRSELGDKYLDELFALYEGRVPHEADLVCYWFERARQQIANNKAGRAGLLATQGIRAGASRKILDAIKISGDIFMAWDDRPWVLDGAAVRVSMVGFDGGKEKTRTLNAATVAKINADLSESTDLTVAQRLHENSGIAFQGPVKVGEFELSDDLAQKMFAQGNPNGRSNLEVIKPWMNASDVVKRSRGMWIIDFGEMGQEDAALFEAPFEHLNKTVRAFRENNNDHQRRTFWWRLGRSGGDFKKARIGKSRVIVTPRVAKHRLFAWANAELVPDSRLFAFAREDDYFFGMLHSHIHEVWTLHTCSWHGVGNDPTYNTSTCFETFAFPWPPGKEPKDDPRVKAIAAAARELVQKRDAWLNPPDASAAELKKRTLTNLYNENPTWLQNAHRELDQAVLAAYGWPIVPEKDISDQDILARLLQLNAERGGSKKAAQPYV